MQAKKHKSSKGYDKKESLNSSNKKSSQSTTSYSIVVIISTLVLLVAVFISFYSSSLLSTRENTDTRNRKRSNKHTVVDDSIIDDVDVIDIVKKEAVVPKQANAEGKPKDVSLNTDCVDRYPLCIDYKLGGDCPKAPGNCHNKHIAGSLL